MHCFQVLWAFHWLHFQVAVSWSFLWNPAARFPLLHTILTKHQAFAPSGPILLPVKFRFVKVEFSLRPSAKAWQWKFVELLKQGMRDNETQSMVFGWLWYALCIFLTSSLLTFAHQQPWRDICQIKWKTFEAIVIYRKYQKMIDFQHLSSGSGVTEGKWTEVPLPHFNLFSPWFEKTFRMWWSRFPILEGHCSYYMTSLRSHLVLPCIWIRCWYFLIWFCRKHNYIFQQTCLPCEINKATLCFQMAACLDSFYKIVGPFSAPHHPQPNTKPWPLQGRCCFSPSSSSSK